jgi:hypothetical protein
MRTKEYMSNNSRSNKFKGDEYFDRRMRTSLP